ncbi:hypothetical protein RB1749 [Rhodopirellula baltica SH 1]|uniref:Uncharacterized protein n=1 Tax=Rhodopirellula baltica (strain DSM 10527 / NCIMB 13988 / SH1) TaxID=243090 RepID=Q7UWW3_RHOBA|nr:hypothetical protein RB1749 [Rhodopirellula baltica SH 1]
MTRGIVRRLAQNRTLPFDRKQNCLANSGRAIEMDTSNSATFSTHKKQAASPTPATSGLAQKTRSPWAAT